MKRQITNLGQVGSRGPGAALVQASDPTPPLRSGPPGRGRDTGGAVAAPFGLPQPVTPYAHSGPQGVQE